MSRERQPPKGTPTRRADRRCFVYIAQCSDGTLYVGIAQDVVARLALHDSGRGARYTRGRGPLHLLAKRRCASKGDALRLEHAIKRLARREKLRVAASRSRLAALARSLARGGRF